MVSPYLSGYGFIIIYTLAWRYGGLKITEKNILRQQMKAIRNNLSNQQIKEKSRRIFNKLTSNTIYVQSKTIMAYASFSSEVSTDEFLVQCLADGKNLALPLISKDKTFMTARVIRKMDDLVAGVFGIMEPIPKKTVELLPCDIDLMIVPGLAFDKDKYRLGYGKAYYDHFLANGLNKECIRIGVAYDFQVLSGIPVESHDIPLDLVITEVRDII